jgi:hypothetical protein
VAALPDAAEVAARFEVSPLAAEWRLYRFGLLVELPRRRT